MIFASKPSASHPLRAAIRAAYHADEGACVERLLREAELPAEARARVEARARDLVIEMRRRRTRIGGLDAFLHEYGLSTREGVALMCLAEALLRIPDAETADRLIRDKLGAADWEAHLGHSESVFVNASTWALMLTGRMMRPEELRGRDLGEIVGRLMVQSGEPLIREAVRAAMRILGRQFVMGRTIHEALERARPAEKRDYRHSYDMLGEAALTAADAERYFHAYDTAISAVAREAQGKGPVTGPGVSVKLSALHPRYEFAQRERVLDELVPRLKALALRAREAEMNLTVDAEEANRLDLSLDVIEGVFTDSDLGGWEGFGLAVQAYQKRAPAVIEWLAEISRRVGRRLQVRLVKGAYWDTEIKRAQEGGFADYPVFTRKGATDVSYLACAKRLFANADAFYPQFATHNAHTLSAVLELAGNSRDFEFQRLHGMGEALYEQIVDDGALNLPCRVYAPVGSHEDLLPYLVRRLLENGANTSFVNRIVDEEAPVESIVADPLAALARQKKRRHPRIPPPPELYGEARRNARGLDLTDPAALEPLAAEMEAAAGRGWRAAPLIGGRARAGRDRAVRDPADRRRVVGTATEASEEDVDTAMNIAAGAASGWAATPVEERARCLDRMADLLEANIATVMALTVREAGKTLPEAVAEVREAVDYCRYYALRARTDFAAPRALPGPTGEHNEISLYGRGVFACISPWNFPLAIFTGQVTAALVAGNAVAAKPAEQTPLVAAETVRLLHEAGVPPDVLQLLPGDGRVGARIVSDPRIDGVAFTGSVDTARSIAQALAGRPGPIVPLIAETGGQNAMIVDSSALAEQVVADVATSTFKSAGQRCSALRVLFLQEEVAPHMLDMLCGAMAELSIGDPGLLSTDVGPVIDADALERLERHAARMRRDGELLFEATLPADCAHGTFCAPRIFGIDRIDRLEEEVFGPILHVVRYREDRLDEVIDAVNATGYGLTLGIHSRIDETVERICRRARVGNIYVNRSMVGSVVGVQPFGGEGLSGTGPKAGGPHYLLRFATERTRSVNTAAAGGNATLLSLQDEDVKD